MPGSVVDLTDHVTVGSPVVEVAPALGAVLGKGGVEDVRPGLAVGRETFAGAEPLLVQRVEAVQRVAQDAELVDPAGLRGAGRNQRQLCVGGVQQLLGACAQVLERCGGVGIALLLAQPVGVVVVRPAVEVGVLVGVDVPGVEDLLDLADVAVEVAQELTVSVRVGDRGVLSRGQRRAASRAAAGAAGEVLGLLFCRRAARTLARMLLRRSVCASTICSGLSGLGV